MEFRKKIILLVVGFLLFNGLLIFFPLRKVVFETKESEKEILTLKQKENEFLGKIEKLRQFDQKKYAQLESALFDPKDPLPFINFLEGMAKQNDLTLNLKPGGGENLFSLSLSGESSRLLRFLSQLENGPYFVRIKKLTLNKGEKELEAQVLIEVLAKPKETKPSPKKEEKKKTKEIEIEL